MTTEERETTVTEPPLSFYKQLTSMSKNEEPQLEQSLSSGSVPTKIGPLDGTDPTNTVEEYLNSIVAALIFSSGIEPNQTRTSSMESQKSSFDLIYTTRTSSKMVRYLTQ